MKFLLAWISSLFLLLVAARVFALPIGLDGIEFSVAECNPNLATCTSLGTVAVGPGVEFSGVGLIPHDIDVSSGGLSITYAGIFNASLPDADFYGFVLTDINDVLGDILNVSFSSGSGYSGLNAPTPSWDADSIWINFSGLSAGSDPASSVSFDIAIAADSPQDPDGPAQIGEPAPLGLLVLGLLVLLVATKTRLG